MKPGAIPGRHSPLLVADRISRKALNRRRLGLARGQCDAEDGCERGGERKTPENGHEALHGLKLIKRLIAQQCQRLIGLGDGQNNDRSFPFTGGRTVAAFDVDPVPVGYCGCCGEPRYFDDEEIKLKKGDIMVFPSSFQYPHRVAPVTKGVRDTFVSWVW